MFLKKIMNIAIIAFVVCFAISIALPATANAATIKNNSYVSFKSDDVNMRSGPSKKFPILWHYKKKHLPVQIIAKYKNWVKVKDYQNDIGWIHSSNISTKKYFIVIKPEKISLFKEESNNSPKIALLAPRVIGAVKSCNDSNNLCEVQVREFHGWVAKDAIWGAAAN